MEMRPFHLLFHRLGMWQFKDPVVELANAAHAEEKVILLHPSLPHPRDSLDQSLW
jgi:hypothetical protein